MSVAVALYIEESNQVNGAKVPHSSSDPKSQEPRAAEFRGEFGFSRTPVTQSPIRRLQARPVTERGE